MLLRDRLIARLDEMGSAPDYPRLAADVLGIRNAPPALAERLVSQALVVEDRRETWERIGARICAAAPATPGVYILRDASGHPLYVGKATNLRRRLRTHFAGRRWRGLKAAFARAVDAEWIEVGSEIEALLREAALIHQLQPQSRLVNVQTGPPAMKGRAVPEALMRDVIVIVPSIEAESVELVGARVDGAWLIARARREGASLKTHAARLTRFFRPATVSRQGTRRAAAAPDGPLLAPIVFSWLAQRGAASTRLDPHDVTASRSLHAKLALVLADERLFTERIVVR
jgi:predicted GIY-YIG superfamily endonuclease